MRRVLSSFGGVIPAASQEAVFGLSRQGQEFRLDRVFFKFSGPSGVAADTWYFVLEHMDGAGNLIASISSTESETMADAPSGAMHFFAEVEFRSHLDGFSVVENAATQLMTAPLGCEGFHVQTNDVVRVRFAPVSGAGLSEDLTVGQIYWHCVFDKPSKSN